MKRSDLVREHGRGALQGDATLSRISAEGTFPARSSKAKILTFRRVMCRQCNNERSQSFDRAYDEFISYLWASEPQVLTDRSLDLEARWGTERRNRGNDVLRFFAKHVCCRIAELTTSEQRTFIPPDIIGFLDGGSPPASLRYELSIEPVQLRMEALWSGHPRAARTFFLDDLWTTGRGE